MHLRRSIQRYTITLALAATLLLTACAQSSPPAIRPLQINPAADIDQPTPNFLGSSPESIRFERITSGDGLSHPYVRGIRQDHLGFMWLATTNGLNLYDGYTFTVFRNQPGDRSSLDFDDLRLIYEDSDHNLWVAGAGGVDRMDRASGEFSRLDENGQVFCMLESQDGLLWVGFWHGLYAFDRATGEIQHAFPSRLSNNLDPDDNLQGFIRAIDEDAHGDLWLGTDLGLYHLDRQTNRLQRYVTDPDALESSGYDRVFSVLIDTQGAIWAGTGLGLYRLDRTRGTFSHHPFYSEGSDSLSTDQVTVILEAGSGNLWAGTTNGLVYFNPVQEQVIRFLHDPNNSASLSANIIFDLFQDPTGLLWVGTANGVSILNPRANQFNTIRDLGELVDPTQARSAVPTDLSELGVEAILEDQGANLWVGTMIGGLFCIPADAGEIKVYQNNPDQPGSLLDNQISAIYQDSNGTLWIGTGNGWLERYDPEADGFTPVKNVPAQIVALSEDQEGNLWIGTRTKGAFSWKIDQGVLSAYPYTDPAQFRGSNVFSSHIITSIITDHAGNPWFGTYLGGVNLRIRSWLTYYRHDPDEPNSLSHNYVLSFFEDNQDGKDVMWIGSMGGGLNRLDLATQTFTHYRTGDGLADDIVTCIQGDDNGMLWMSTPKGLTRFDPEQGTFWNFNERDGVPSGSIIPGGCLQRTDGSLVFTTLTSIVIFDPGQVQVNPYAPPLAITNLMVSGQPAYTDITRDLSIRLPYQENNLGFEFVALDYAYPEGNTFAYRMEGADKEWVFAGTSHRVDYPNLNPGTYTFRVRGANSDGVWNEQGLAVKVSITPPLWMTGWFLGLVGAGLLMSAISAYRTRMQRMALQQQELERQVRERTEEINQRRKEIEALYQADESLYRHLDLEQVLQALIDTAVQLLEADKGSVMCWDEAGENLVIRAAHNFSTQTVLNARIPRGMGSAGSIAQYGTTATVEDTAQEPNVTQAIIQPENIRAFIQVPIKIGAEVFGVFSADYTAPRAFTDDEIRLLLALAQRAATAIQNAQLYEAAQELAATQERSRLARDLHDAVTQTLFSASLIAEALPMLWERNPQKGQDSLLKLRQLNRGALAEMRTLLLELRPAALMEANLGDLVRQLGESATGRTGIPVHIHIEGMGSLPAEVHLAAYRIIQEAVNNAVKHAKATQIAIQLTCSGPQDGEVEAVKLSITDDGIGFDADSAAPEKLGLKIMRERAQSIAAVLTLESQPGKGTRVSMDWQAVNS